ncbi:F-box/kelch-repeat protein At3g06240-like [Papaver somniferum]|uniref:F-box/kelch-repeat protein At3g06240-like n=1 Tax=Papaver somniferum TaxID=3469 RepID=UPI000E6F4D7C|nr:F-box/kelch-repeat protein At3g06240-like [Papaver somniferum]
MVLSTFDKCEWNGDIQMDYPFDAETTIYSLKVVGSCNGLVCLIYIFNGDLIRSKDDRICIWNPTTREYKEVSLPPYDSLVKEDCYNIRYGFGYDSATDNYKVVRISGHRKSPNCLKMQVYALGSDSWEYIDDSISYSFNDFRSTCTSFGLFFHGALHWIGKSRKTSSDVIVTFGISNERLMDMPSIEKSIGGWGGLDKEVGLLGDCLSLAVAVIFARLDVWVMKEY